LQWRWCWHISVFVGPCIPFKNLATMDVYSILFLIEKNGFMCTYVFECITKVVVMFWHILAWLNDLLPWVLNIYIYSWIVFVTKGMCSGTVQCWQTVSTPLTQRLLHWGELENSILFCGAGVEVRDLLCMNTTCLYMPVFLAWVIISVMYCWNLQKHHYIKRCWRFSSSDTSVV